MSVKLRAQTAAAPPATEQQAQPSFYPEEAKTAAPALTEELTPSYYDVPMLKQPTWGWEIAGYFLLGGLSAGAYLISRLADRLGGERYKSVAKVGTAVAAASFLPCPPLLIKDLGDPKRFHHMLRIIKPISPMNVGTWTLTGYGGALTLSAIREWLMRKSPNAATKALGLSDIAGIPLALTMAGYTGVLLNTTSTPLWARNSWLGAAFSASAFHSGADAVDLWLALQQGRASVDPSEAPLQDLKTLTRVAEAAAITGYIATSGRLTDTITRKRYAPLFWIGAVGIGMVAPTILERYAKKQKTGPDWFRIGASVLGLVGSLALRWAIVYGGRESADDSTADRMATGTK